MSDRLRNILDAAIAKRPNEFKQLMDAEIGERIVNKINSQYENTFIDGDSEQDDIEDGVEDDVEDDEEEFDFDEIEDLDLDDIDLDISEEAAVKTKESSIELTKKQGILSQTRDPAQKRFVAKHHVKKDEDRNGNSDELFNAANVKSSVRPPEHGYNPGEDEAVYEEAKPKMKRTKKPMKKRSTKSYM